MGTVNIIRHSDDYTKTCQGIHSDGIVDFRYNGSTITSTTTTVNSTLNRVNFAIDTKLMKEHNTIISAKLTLHTYAATAIPVFVLYKETSITTVSTEVIGRYIADSDGKLEIDLVKYVCEAESDIVYFSVGSENADDAVIYTQYSEFLPKIEYRYIGQGQAFLNQKYIEGSVGRALDYKINVRNGEGVFTKSLVTLGGNLMPINLGLVYDNFKGSSVWFGGMPYGWKTNYHQRVSPKSDGTIIYTDSSGFEHVFEKALNSNTVYFDVAGTGLILTINGDGTKVIDDGYKNYLQFNIYGYLERIRHGEGVNKIATVIEYDSSRRIKYICDGMDRTYTFTYNTHYVKITGPGVKDITLNISNNELNSILECGERVSTYTYSNSYLSTATSDNGEKVGLIYDENMRVYKVEEKDSSDSLLKSNQFFYKIGTSIYDEQGCETFKVYMAAALKGFTP